MKNFFKKIANFAKTDSQTSNKTIDKTIAMYKIEDATAADAPIIADAILEAIGEEICLGLAGDEHNVEDVHALFARLAARTDTQYSYLNTRIARDEHGAVAGVCVSYDGARLKQLRRAFFAEANKSLGWSMTDEEIENVPGETEADEYYLDTLMTVPEHRGHGVGRSLIMDAHAKAAATGKPLGLLCDIDNDRARRLYDSVGFEMCGLRPFAGHEMYHLQMK